MIDNASSTDLGEPTVAQPLFAPSQSGTARADQRTSGLGGPGRGVGPVDQCIRSSTLPSFESSLRLETHLPKV